MQTFTKENGTTYFKGQMEYVKPLETCLQPNQISQGLYKCSGMAKKILAYVISDLNVVKWNNSKFETYETIFKPVDFIKTLGLQRTGKQQQQLIKDALIELQQSYIAIDTGEKFETFSWVTHSVYAEKERKIAIEINHHLGKALMEYKKGYTAIQLVELGKLQSFYAMRFYEIALSYSGFEGKQGNKKKNWFFEYSIQDIRQLFQMKDDEYKGRMTNFITKVIAGPLAEVCQKTNIDITFEKIKNSKEIIGIRFNCTRKDDKVKIAKTDSLKLKQEKIEINEEEDIIARNRKRFEELYQEELKTPNLFGTTTELFAKSNAFKRLKKEIEN
ncbi:MAG TPA: replication initiation protein [Treponemataceae bacterium]|nr:replication initiation protein [Treponemataceae bacterium]